MNLVVGFEAFDLNSERSHLLLPPHVSRADAENFRSHLPELPAHVWLLTSGTTAAPKLVALSKTALTASAQAVQTRLEDFGIRGAQSWLLTLPLYHVGGLGIYVRARLTQSRVANLPLENGRPAWKPERFLELLQKHRVTLTSLVPTQVYDLVAQGLRAPTDLRLVFVGGGALDESLARQAAELGWPLLTTYGMTETSSMIAHAPEIGQVGDRYRLFPQVEARLSEDGRLEFRGPSLLTGYVSSDADPDLGEWPLVACEGWYRSEDLGEVEGESLRLRGRGADFLKIQGENVSLVNIERRLKALAPGFGVDAASLGIFWKSDERRGAELILGLRRRVEESEGARKLLEAYNREAPGFERVSGPEVFLEFPTTELAKLRRRLS